jgi:hypothetical protein
MLSQRYDRDWISSRAGALFRRRRGQTGPGAPNAHEDHRLERLIRRLPENRQASVRWLRSSAGRWVRMPLGVFFILGSFLFVLPIFGLWMLPVGLLLLAEDVRALRGVRARMLDWVEYYRPHWFYE